MKDMVCAFQAMCRKFWSLPLSSLFLVCIILVLSGCARSVTKPLPATIGAAELAGLSDEKPKESILDKTPEQLLASGWTYLATGSAGLARLHFQTALQKSPQSAEAFIGLGKVEFHLRNFPAAALYFRKAAELDPDNVPALVGAVRALRRANRLDEAETLLLRAQAIAPDDLQVLSERAILHDLLGQEDLAEPIYRQILERNPKQAATLNNLGVNRLLDQAYGDAIVYFRQALLLDGKSPRLKNNLAMAYALNGDEPKALRLFTETVGEAGAYNNLGYLYLTINRLDDAERALNKALELNPRFYEKAQENLDRVQELRIQAN